MMNGTCVDSSYAWCHFWNIPPCAPSRSPWSEVKITMVLAAISGWALSASRTR